MRSAGPTTCASSWPLSSVVLQTGSSGSTFFSRRGSTAGTFETSLGSTLLGGITLGRVRSRWLGTSTFRRFRVPFLVPVAALAGEESSLLVGTIARLLWRI